MSCIRVSVRWLAQIKSSTSYHKRKATMTSAIKSTYLQYKTEDA